MWALLNSNNYNKNAIHGIGEIRSKNCIWNKHRFVKVLVLVNLSQLPCPCWQAMPFQWIQWVYGDLQHMVIPLPQVELQMEGIHSEFAMYIWGIYQQATFVDPNSLLGLVDTNIALSVNLYLCHFCRSTGTSTQLDYTATLCLAHSEQLSKERFLEEIPWAFICFALKKIQTVFVLLFWNVPAPFLDRL